MNVVLYGERSKRWAMTERGRSSLSQSADALTIGPSTISWNGAALTLDVDEIAVPLPRHIRGRIRLYPQALAQYRAPLDAGHRHWWQPFAPSARVEVELSHPALRWSGTGYFDSNAGSAPLEQDFVAWNWSRCHRRDATEIFYDVQPRDAANTGIALAFDRSGRPTEIEPPVQTSLPATLWRVDRLARTVGRDQQLVRTFEDTPFYARSLISASRKGERALTMHESLSLDRFRSLWVQTLLPFRMPRRGW
jgi:carotenoid 1,2-hydratase